MLITRQSAPFQLGVEVLLQRPAWLEGRRAALVGHPASVNSKGVHSAHLLKEAGANLVCLMGPEHGFWGRGGAGEQVDHQTHSEWGLPIYSLYGAARKPSPEMLEGVDVILFDLQDLGSRNYTYVSTLRYVLEAAAETGKTVVVADRPIPFPNGVDGPMREDASAGAGGLLGARVNLW